MVGSKVNHVLACKDFDSKSDWAVWIICTKLRECAQRARHHLVASALFVYFADVEYVTHVSNNVQQTLSGVDTDIKHEVVFLCVRNHLFAKQ
mgnify:CR=1 FL=1